LMRSRIHILNQFIWPDGAPTGIYAEQLAAKLTGEGMNVRLVGSRGVYRKSQRERPALEIVYVGKEEVSNSGDHNKLGIFRKYIEAWSAFRTYIRSEVAPDDLVIVTSAPPNSIGLYRDIAQRKARSIYWLQDYYPDLLRGLWHYPDFIKAGLDSFWFSRLSRWDLVVKISENLGYCGKNTRLIRNWPTLKLQPKRNSGKTALYTGNLGYGHDIASFIKECERLRGEGYTFLVRGDGIGVRQLPSWMDSGPSFGSEEKLRSALEEADLHLIAAHPKIQSALFPSKFWNARATGNPLLPIGFSGSMLKEFNAALQVDYNLHLDAWVETIKQMGIS
jgi:hypothetical protein